ncbi:glycogen synthase [Colwellia sp. MEBiC06753]
MVNILFAAAENDALPNGKVGGIGDVIRDVPHYLSDNNTTIDVITPSYGMHAKHPNAQQVLNFTIHFCGQPQVIELYQIQIPAPSFCQGQINQWVLEHPIFSNGGVGNIYFDDGPNRPFASDASKFALFSLAVCHLLANQWHSRIDIIHLHDWHSAWVAILRAFAPEFECLQQKRTVYTIHNLSLQGIRPIADDESSLNHWFPQYNLAQPAVIDPRYTNCVNPTRAAINLVDAVHAVSPTYAQEILLPSDPTQGFIGGEGLEADLFRVQEQHRLFGILNGCEYSETPLASKADPEQLLKLFFDSAEQALARWSSQSPHQASSHFTASERIYQWQKTPCNGPIITSVGRITSQKVAILLVDIAGKTVLSHLLNLLAYSNSRLIILGSGEKHLEQQIHQIISEHDNGLFLNGYDNALSESAFALGDMFLMPSSFEPCGISQLLALRAGQPCIVHKIGGLNDTISHGETGFCFNGDNPLHQGQALIDTVEQAINCFLHQPERWAKLVENAKATRFDWPSVMPAYRKQLYKLS